MNKILISSLVALGVGAGIGYLAAPSLSGDTGPADTGAQEKKVLYWKAPMDKNFRSDKPGKSPMGMDLIPVYEGDEPGADDPNALKISAAVVNNIGVRTEAVKRADLSREVDTVGYISIDEDLSSHVHVRTAGWVEKLHRKAVGESVKKGELIFELYSPELVNAQTEFVQALRLTQSSLARASRERLKALGMTDSQIKTLEKTREIKQLIEVRAPQDGVIVKLEIGEGMHVSPAKTVFSLADLSTVWVQVDVFEGQSDWVQEDQDVAMTLPFLPGETWEGKVDYVYPFVNERSRTVQVRLAFPNSDARLKPNMYGEIRIEASPVEDVVTIPREALIRTGKTDRVILALEDNKFRPAEVLVGREAGDLIEIKDGLKAGETVVTSGQFLIDSEASLNSAFLRLLDAGSEDETTMDHSGHTGHEDHEEEDEAAMDHSGHNEPEGQDEAPVEVHHGMGMVNSVSEGGIVNLTHENIASLGWPAMTMDFSTASDVDLSKFEAGDMVHFELVRKEDGSYVITNASKM